MTTNASRRACCIGPWALIGALLLAPACSAQVFPGAAWESRLPADVGLDAAKLDVLRDYVGGRGCVVRQGYMVYTWGDQAYRQDIASAAKPWYTHFLLEAVEDGRLAGLDEPVAAWEPCLNTINAALGHKDRQITFGHMANQTSCYGVRETSGTAFDYNDWQMALFWDTLFLRVYGTTYASVDASVLHPMLTSVLQCQDNPTLMAFGTADRPGRMRISVRDFARFGLLYLRQGNWKGTQLISKAHATMAVSSPLPLSIPRTSGEAAEMCPNPRTIGSAQIPDDQTDHDGSYSWLWWVNGITRSGARYWPDAPADTFGAFGHSNGQRALAVIPSLDLVVSWNDTTLGSKPGNPNEALKRLVAAVIPGARTVRPDFDEDGDVDVEDFAHLQECLTEVGLPYPAHCADADVSGDQYIDQTDIGVFLSCLTGPGLLAEETCDDAS